MKNADWIKKGPLTNRVDFPRWLADITGKFYFNKNTSIYLFDNV